MDLKMDLSGWKMADSVESLDETVNSIRTVVVAIDGSVFAERAFDFFLENVKKDSDNIVLVHVPEYHGIMQLPKLFTDPVIVNEIIKDEERQTKLLLKKYSKKLQAAGVGGKLREMSGKIGETIIAAAREEEADLIVIGTRRLSKIRRTVIGSVSDYILKHAGIPVLVCRK